VCCGGIVFSATNWLPACSDIVFTAALHLSSGSNLPPKENYSFEAEQLAAVINCTFKMVTFPALAIESSDLGRV
jgi:hypothetical protein